MFGLGLLLEDESAAAEHARLTGVAGRFEKPREGTWLHLEALEGRCVGHSFTVDAGRLTIKTQVPLLLVSQSDEAPSYRNNNIRVVSGQSLEDPSAFADTELLARAVEAADFPELAAARAHLARLRLRVRRRMCRVLP